MKLILTCGEILGAAFTVPYTDLDYIREARNLVAIQFPNYDIELFVNAGRLVVPMEPTLQGFVEFDIIPYEDLQP